MDLFRHLTTVVNISGCNRKSIFLLTLRFGRERNSICYAERAQRTPQNDGFFKFSLNSYATYLSSFFDFPNHFKWLEMVAMSTSNSRTVVCGIASIRTSHGRPLRSSTLRVSSQLRNFLNHHCAVGLLVVSWPNASLIS